MNHQARRIVETLACERRYAIADQKGSEYSGAGETYKETGADTLRNFKAVAERLGITPEQALMGYLHKHMDSINTMVREAASLKVPFLDHGPKAIYANGEGIVSRLDDARNYLDLLECLLIDNGHIGCEQKLSMAGMLDAPKEETTRDDVAAAEKFIKDYSPVIGLSHDPNGQTFTEYQQEQELANAGLVEGMDGVWRGKTTIDESVRNPGERQTPIYAQPAVFEPTMDKVRHEPETGEL